jgi:hypothetical protein
VDWGNNIYFAKYIIAYSLVQTIQLTIQYLLSTIISSYYIYILYILEKRKREKKEYIRKKREKEKRLPYFREPLPKVGEESVLFTQ